MVALETRLKFYRRAQSLRQLCENDPSGSHAKRLALSVLCLWQEEKYPYLRENLRRPHGTSHYMAMSRVAAFAQWLAKHEDFSVAAYWLASAYAIWVGDDSRQKRSLYFTPPRLAQRVINDLIAAGASLSVGAWHDPACGGAAFLVPVAERMAQELRTKGKSAATTLRHIERNLSGSDLEGVLLELSREFLRMALYDLIIESNHLPDFDLRFGDGLALPLGRKPDVIICNPPYRKLKSDEASTYASDYSSIMEGQPNIYGLFIYRTMQIVAKGGFIGLLTPTSFLSGQNFSKLRSALLATGQPVRIDILSGRKSTFIDVEQETAIMVVRAGERVGHVDNAVAVAIRTSQGKFEDIGKCVIPGCGRPWPLPRSSEDLALVREAGSSAARLSDYGYRAKIGHLVDYRDSRPRMSIAPWAAHLEDIFPLVWATDIAPGGRFEHGRVRRGNKNELYVHTGNGERAGVITKPSIVMQRVTSTDQPCRLVCAAVPSEWLKRHKGFVAENHVIVIEQLHAGEPALNPETLSAVLRSAPVDRLFRSISGASNVSVFELNELPLPPVTTLQRELRGNCTIEEAVLVSYSTSMPNHRAA